MSFKIINENLNVDCELDSQSVTFIFKGNMDTVLSNSISKILPDILDELISDGFVKQQMKITFDLGQVIYISSFFLRICFVALKFIEKGNFYIINASQQVNNILKISGLEKVTKIINKEEDAIVFRPLKEFSEKANIKSIDEYKSLYNESINNPLGFWKNQAIENINWFEPFDEVLRWELPRAKWFVNGKLNISYNCIDKWLSTPIEDKIAILWEGEPFSNGKPEKQRAISYKELHAEVCTFANVLKKLGIKKGDRVIIYLPMIPEAIYAMLACARIGAIHSVIFAGFSAQAIAERAEDCQAVLIITADEGFRRGKLLSLKDNVDKAIEIIKNKNENNAILEKVLIIERTQNQINIVANRDYLYSAERKEVIEYCEPEIMDSEDVLFILYTSGSTGKPKGIFHSSAGYLLGATLSFKYIMDYKDSDIFWCSADIGWITGHSYVVYGPLSNGATIFIYEGAPDYPSYDRFWRIIEKNRISILYSAPTAIRAFMKWGEKWLEGYDLSSLRLLGTVGEPINPEAWLWYYENIGKSKCPIVDTWWQTETGSIMISPIPGISNMKPSSAAIPFLGVEPEILNDDGNPSPVNIIGNLVIKKPWPSMARGIWASSERFKQVYWSEFPGYYYTGDSARRDEDGYYWIVGRVDDVIVVSGHNIGSAEVESALVSHHSVAESAVVGRPDDLKTTVIVAFVTLKSGVEPSNELANELKKRVGDVLGHLAKPEEIRFTEALPKTRSGKIMRRFLRQIASGTEVTGDITTLEDFAVLQKLSSGDS